MTSTTAGALAHIAAPLAGLRSCRFYTLYTWTLLLDRATLYPLQTDTIFKKEAVQVVLENVFLQNAYYQWDKSFQAALLLHVQTRL